MLQSFCVPFTNKISVKEEIIRVHRLFPRNWLVSSTRIWGPSMWHYIHLTSLYHTNYPFPQSVIEEWLKNLPKLLPCPECHMNLKQKLRQEYYVGIDLFSLFVKIHNTINKEKNYEMKSESDMKEYYLKILSDLNLI